MFEAFNFRFDRIVREQSIMGFFPSTKSTDLLAPIATTIYLYPNAHGNTGTRTVSQFPVCDSNREASYRRKR